jgi:hypothetical protein
MRHIRWIAAASAIATAFILGCGSGDNPVSPTDQQPVLGSIAPDSGNVGTAVDVRGQYFAAGAVVMFGNQPAARVALISHTLVRAYAPDGLVLGQSYAVSIRNASSPASEASRSYKAVGPQLQVVNGVSRPSGLPGSTCIFEGKSFGDLTGKGTVYFTGSGGPTAAAVESGNWHNEYIIATVPNDAQSGPVWVTTPLGSTASINFVVSEQTSFSPSVIAWTPTTSLPSPSQGHGAHFIEIDNGGSTDDVVFVTGGADGTPTSRPDVLVGTIGATGQITAWTATTALPEARAFHATATATPWNALVDTLAAGYLYVIGGNDASGTVRTTVLYTSVAKDHSLGGWAETTPLPVPLHSAGATVLRSWLYVVGGATTGDTPVATAYRARIEFDGTLGPWQQMTSLPQARAYAPLVQFAGNLYVLGGDTGTSAPASNNTSPNETKSILYQDIDLRTGGLKNSSWLSAGSQLIKADSKHSVIVASGWLLASGGLYNGAASSATEHQYAEIQPDGSVTSFNGATGSQTITSAGGVPFYNHAAITYVDGSSVSHVLIIGGANVTDPAHPTAGCYFY